MKASVVDLRYRMNDVLKALDRNEEVSILYHGKVKGVIKPATKTATKKRMIDHPFCNMGGSSRSVEEEMRVLRGGRYRDL